MSAVPGFNIGENGGAGAQASKEEEAMAQLGGDVEIILKLPDGSDKTHTFKVGQSVAYLKAWIEKEYEVKYATQTLLLSGAPMIDPMCLNDYSIANGAVIEVKASE